MPDSTSDSTSIYSFALNLPLYNAFDYRVDEGQEIRPGQRFIVPFGNADKVAVVLGRAQGAVDDSRLRSAGERLDDHPLVSRHIMQLAQWMAQYYQQPQGEAVFQCLPAYCRAKRPAVVTEIEFWVAAKSLDEASRRKLATTAPLQWRVLQAIEQTEGGADGSTLKAVSAGWRAAAKGLVEKGLVRIEKRDLLPQVGGSVRSPCELTSVQRQVLNGLLTSMQHFHAHLIHGVTGSGKTEIYLELMMRCIEAGRQVIYLAPEIGLTPQLLDRLRATLGPVVVSSHSSHSDFQRYQAWDQFRRGAAKVMLGTRSTLFSDAPALGLIIVDEEHDDSYRQQDGLRYHARDVAIKRAQMLDIPIVLGSATPSLESLHNCDRTHFSLHRLDERPNRSTPPRIELINTANSPLQAGCSPPLIDAIEKQLDQKGQVLLFLNRRGFAPVVMCHGCGWQAQCFQCDARLTLHRSIDRLVCHHCGFSQPAPEKCPDCGASGVRHFGVGTQQLEGFLRQRFAQVETIRMDRDSVASARDFERNLRPLREGDPCILIGTQMLAKGHDYPHIGLVGIIDADQALHSGFYRASERLVQTVLQVSGRAGRADRPGRALLQTAFPEHPLMQGLCRRSYAELAQEILNERKLLGFPPFERAISFVVDALELEHALARLNTIRSHIEALKVPSSLRMVGPLPALMTRRIGRYRAQLSLMCRDMKVIRSVLAEVMPMVQKQRNDRRSRLVVEVDPIDL